MAEKSVKFSDENVVREFEKAVEEDEGRLKKGKHTLDSDEEDDDGDKYDVMKEDDIEGKHILTGRCPTVGLSRPLVSALT
jgi:hypothetical protein